MKTKWAKFPRYERTILCNDSQHVTNDDVCQVFFVFFCFVCLVGFFFFLMDFLLDVLICICDE